MTVIVSQLSVAQAATIINATIIIVQYTLSLSLVTLLFYFLPRSTSALSWSAIGRVLHSSLWPPILRADSSTNRNTGIRVSTFSRVSMLGVILIAVAGVTLPLGLHDGPLIPSEYREVPGRYLPDTSALAMARTPVRNFIYGRSCLSVSCIRNQGNKSDTPILPSIREIFNSTVHGPFSMQFRRFFNGSDNHPDLSVGVLGTLQSFILRDDIFFADGVIVDMNSSHPGIGFWNQTVPVIAGGGTWSQDVLWLEPLTQCVNTNLTVEFFERDGPQGLNATFNITDHGGFVNLPHTPPPFNRDGQHVNLAEHAYAASFQSNSLAMHFLNATRESSYDSKPYPINRTDDLTYLNALGVGSTTYLRLSYLNESNTINTSAESASVGFGEDDVVNMTNVHISCGIFLGPVLSSSGDEFQIGSRARQPLHSCCSATRARIARITFSTNSTPSLADIRISRDPVYNTVLWAMEKTDARIDDFEALWGRVDDKYEDSPDLWTVRSDYFYLPAGASSIRIVPLLSSGNPSSTHAVTWNTIYNNDPKGALMDYNRENNFAVTKKLDDLTVFNEPEGQGQALNLMWTDIMVNNVIAGKESDSTLLVAELQTTIDYDFKYAIPGFLLLLIWVPSFLTALFLLVTRMLTFGYVREVLNHTSVGHVVVGTSVLHAVGPYDVAEGATRLETDLADSGGRTQVVLDLRKTEVIQR